MTEKINSVKVISRNSALALQQVSDLFGLLQGISYELISLKSPYRIYHEKSLYRPLKDIITMELNQAVLVNEADLAIYPAADLPYPIPSGLEVIALTDNRININSQGLQAISVTDPGSVAAGEDPFGDFLVLVSRTGREDMKARFAGLDLIRNFGKVTLVGFGPGNPDLLTIGGDKALSHADCIFHDDLIDKEFLQKYPAEKIYVGKRKARHSVTQEQINSLLLQAARSGKEVVRLKGGDPMVFAHGGEEIEFLQRNLVEVQVIPGVSAGMAASASAKIPLTQRDISSSVAFISGHTDSVFLPNTDTLVIYMGGSLIRKIAARAIREGRHPDTPVVLISHVSLPDQAESFYTLEELSQSDEKFPTPVIILVGEVVSLRHQPASELGRTVSGRKELQKTTFLSAWNKGIPATGDHNNHMALLNFNTTFNGYN